MLLATRSEQELVRDVTTGGIGSSCSFWNFDALFQPQQHPARDAHDTFFLTSEHTPISGTQTCGAQSLSAQRGHQVTVHSRTSSRHLMALGYKLFRDATRILAPSALGRGRVCRHGILMRSAWCKHVWLRVLDARALSQYCECADPAASPLSRQPQDYVQRVRHIHERGGFGSTGYALCCCVANNRSTARCITLSR